jgi:hypothetical protein
LLFGALSTQLSQMDAALVETAAFLSESSALSSRLNNDINSLEVRKTNATDFLDLMTDLKELDSSVKMVQKALDALDIESASHFFGKAKALVNVVEPRLPIRDMAKFEALKAKLLTILR